MNFKIISLDNDNTEEIQLSPQIKKLNFKLNTRNFEHLVVRLDNGQTLLKGRKSAPRGAVIDFAIFSKDYKELSKLRQELDNYVFQPNIVIEDSKYPNKQFFAYPTGDNYPTNEGVNFFHIEYELTIFSERNK